MTRGVLRLENGLTKKYIAEVEPSPFEAVVSMTVMQVSLGLSQVSDDVVLPVPAIRLLDAPLVGLAARRDNGPPLGPFASYFLFRGARKLSATPSTIPSQCQSRASKSHLRAFAAS